MSGITQMPLRKGMVQEGSRPGCLPLWWRADCFLTFKPHKYRLILSLLAMACVAA
jgi:hypothetical protein